MTVSLFKVSHYDYKKGFALEVLVEVESTQVNNMMLFASENNCQVFRNSFVPVITHSLPGNSLIM